MDISPRLSKASVTLTTNTQPHSSYSSASPTTLVAAAASSPGPLQTRVSRPPSRKRHRFLLSPFAARPPPAKPPTAVIAARLDSCHICRRRPTTKSQLSSYADCDACGQRVCYICLRECEGTCQRGGGGSSSSSSQSLGGRKICSACCVETGSEGTVWCLACYGRQQGGPSERMQDGGDGGLGHGAGDCGWGEGA